MRLYTILLVFSTFFIQYLYPRNNLFTPTNLKCNFWDNPHGIDEQNPSLSWTIELNNIKKRDVRQTAYQVIVATSLKKLNAQKADIWNSEKVYSEKMAQIAFNGSPLVSSKKYWWKVKIWDKNNVESDWSKPVYWTMGILSQDDWKAQWISAKGAEKYAPEVILPRTDFNKSRWSPKVWDNMPTSEDPNFSSMLLRKEFNVQSKLRRAVAHVSGLGQYEMTINGRKVENHLLSPGWTDYRKTVLYDTYDITNLLVSNKNAIGLILSNGMYNIQPDSIRFVKFLNTYGQLKAIVQIQLEYDDGTVRTIKTDSSWQVSTGPITYMNQFGGEDFDARLIENGWDKPNFSASDKWSDAIQLPKSKAHLKGLSGAAPSLKISDILEPLSINKLRPNVWIYDLGQNASIMPQLTINGSPGASVRIIPAELLKADGTVDRSSATQDGVRPAWWQYTKATSESENYFPKFFYQGARYLQVELFPTLGEKMLPSIQKLQGAVVHTSAEPIGAFSCSNKLFNQIYTLVRWAQRSNLMSVITDCPHREKMPWLEQYHLNGPSLRYNYDLLTLFNKAMNDMSDSQLDNGFVPNIAPELFHAGKEIENNGFRNSPEWGSSFIIVPWQHYLYSGDTSLMTKSFEGMRKYLSFLDKMSKNNLLNIGLGDWYDIGPKEPWGSQLTPVAFTATAIYYYDYYLMSKMARVLNKNIEADKFEIKALQIKNAFNNEFYNSAEKSYATGSNTCMAMPLFLGMAPSQDRQSIIDTLVADIRNRDNSFTSGDVGYRFLLKTLAMAGRSDVIFDMNNQSDKPGYGYQLKMGATSLTEKWDASVGSFGSQNHFMLGQINEWFFHDLAGIGWDEDGPGFCKSIIKPSVIGDIKWVKASYKTVSGLIAVAWEKQNHQFILNITIPANTSATVYVPTVRKSNVTESGKQPTDTEKVKYLKMENGCAVYEVSSGNYHFESVIE